MPRSSTYASRHSPARSTKSDFIRLWESGYLYLALSLVLLLIYAASPSVGILDWKKEIAYFTFIRQSLVDFHSLPWFWWNKPAFISAYPAAAHSSSFIANPESMLLSPFTPLLLVMPVVPYIKLLSLIHGLIGLAGSLALRVRLKWLPIQFRVYLLLFLLSPLILQHLAIGYTPWLNLYLFPWFVYFLLDRLAIRRVLGIASVMGFALLQGGTHVALWFALTLLIYALARAFLDRTPRHLAELGAIGLLTAWLSWIRLFATLPVYAAFHQAFGAGYTPLSFLFWSSYPPLLLPALTGLLTSTLWSGIPAWDAGVFWGGSIVLALVLLVNFSSYQRVREAQGRNTAGTRAPAALLISALALLCLSFDGILAGLVRMLSNVSPVDLIEAAEKYPFRLAVPALLVLSLLVAEYAAEIFASLLALERRSRAQCDCLLGA